MGRLALTWLLQLDGMSHWSSILQRIKNLGLSELCTLCNAGEIRWQQRLDSLELALEQLTQACERRPLDNLERAGFIKTFESCFELSWNTLKDLLFHEGYDHKVPRSILRESFNVGYIDERDCEVLLDALEKRNTLSHIYRKDVALAAEDLIRNVYHPVLVRVCRSLDARRSS